MPAAASPSPAARGPGADSPPAIELSAEIARATRLFEEMRARGSDPPGVSRASWGPGEQMAHDLAREWAAELGPECTVDFAGNLYMTLRGRSRQAWSPTWSRWAGRAAPVSCRGWR